MRKVAIGRAIRDPMWVPFLSPCSYGGALRRAKIEYWEVQSRVESRYRGRLVHSRIPRTRTDGGQASTMIKIPACVCLTQQRLCRLCYAVSLFVGVLREMRPRSASLCCAFQSVLSFPHRIVLRLTDSILLIVRIRSRSSLLVDRQPRSIYLIFKSHVVVTCMRVCVVQDARNPSLQVRKPG